MDTLYVQVTTGAQRMINIASPRIGFYEWLAVSKVLFSGSLAQGSEVAKFENEFSRNVNGFKCIAVNSGTSGLHLSLLAAGIGPGDEVIVPSFSFAATANSVALTGATPVFADIELETFNIDPASIRQKITKKTRGIQVVHLFGLPANMGEIKKIAEEKNLLIFEDAAQAHLAKFKGQAVGTFGIAATFSFYPTKNMTSGEGGMIVTNSDAIEESCRLLRNQGMKKRYENEIIGFNNRMTDIHGSIGRVQLKRLISATEKRRKNAEFLSRNLEGVITPIEPDGYMHVYHQYTIRIPNIDRDSFTLELRKRGIETGVYYPTPIHQLPSFREQVDLPRTELASREVVSLPIHPSLSKRDLMLIVDTVNRLVQAAT
jgi:dTDP-4-amino-4,6-dideoxygalactose transaminase